MEVTAHVQRSGDYWAIEVPEVPGVFTQAKRLEQVPAMAADAVKVMTGEDADVSVVFSSDIEDALVELQIVRNQAEEAQARLSMTNRSIAVHLVKDFDLPLRDVGLMMGISHQRVDQLLK